MQVYYSFAYRVNRLLQNPTVDYSLNFEFILKCIKSYFVRIQKKKKTISITGKKSLGFALEKQVGFYSLNAKYILGYRSLCSKQMESQLWTRAT